MDQWIAPERLFDGRDILTGMALRLDGGTVAEIAKAPKDAHKIKGLVTPGYLDLQVNGGGSVMLNDHPTPEGIRTIVAAHRRFGTVALLPTVITDTPDVMEHAAEAAIATKGEDGVIGLHIEGPHISVPRRGVHAEKFVRPLDDRTINVVDGLRRAGVRVMITVAPENATTEQIAKLAAMGAVVSIGHTDAPAEDVARAMAAGANCATHLFNAMSPMMGRAPGAVGAVINSTSYAGIICDGQHVADSMVGLAVRARPVPDRMFLVSDAMATVGGDDSFALYGKPINLHDGRLVNAEGSLAGAHVTQAMGVARLVQKTGTPLETALRMAVSVPADCMSVPELGRLAGRRLRDVLVLNDDLSLRGYLDTLVAPDLVGDA